MPNFFMVNIINLILLVGVIIYSFKKIWRSRYIRKIEAKSIVAIIFFDVVALILGFTTIIPNIISAVIMLYTWFILYKTNKAIKIREKMKKN
ncbi:hypothetical protein [Paraclostridium bifermentans]|uniref:hypothetical protein n=1 Tax=Paraclostridium bifermentans TaxID=1490 RepID=UPI00242AEFBD|nr:hypothetical protein [Paraclostridium bifermentans]